MNPQVAYGGSPSQGEIHQYNSQAYACFCEQNLGQCMYCGNYFTPPAMDLHVAECYRVTKANKEIHRKNQEVMEKRDMSDLQARRFHEKKKKFEEALAQDIMNQFLQEQGKPAQVSKAIVNLPAPLFKPPEPPKQEAPKPSKWAERAKQNNASSTGIGMKPDKAFHIQDDTQGHGIPETSKTPGSGPKGKWKQRAENEYASAGVAVKPVFEFTQDPSGQQPDRGNQGTPPVKHNIYRAETPGAVLNLRDTVTSTSFKAATPLKEAKQYAQNLTPFTAPPAPLDQASSPNRANKWEMKKKGITPNGLPMAPVSKAQQPIEESLVLVQRKPTQSPILMSNGNQALAPEITGPIPTAAQLLQQAAKSMQNVDADLAEKAQAFFFDKMGAALLNNFKNNLVPCSYCQRKFDAYALKKHEPICARTSPLPSKKKA